MASGFQADQRLGAFRLLERLGRGGFAEVWRARPEPTSVGSLDVRARLSALATLAAVLRREDRRAASLVENLRANLELLTVGQAREELAAPEALVAAHEAALTPVLGWLEERSASGALDVALKVPFHEGWVRQLRREGDLLQAVRHPNLVEQYQLDLLHEPPYLAMELVDGWSLREGLRTEPLPPLAKILAVMDQLLAVLDHLHRRGIVHGDVKPENVVMQRDGTLRLIDLGLGRVSQAVMRDTYLSLSLASRVPIQGTLSYMAPEVRRGEPAGPVADLYSAGILLYELLVGDVPTGMALPSEAAAHRGLTERFDILLKWVLHPEPGKRIASAAELRERVLTTLKPRARHALGTGERRGKAREGTHSFDAWALEHASPFVAGDFMGDYQLEEPLGRGGFGEVWRAKVGPWSRPGAVEQVVALKIALGPHGRDALAREAAVGQRLDHSGIPAVHEAHLEHDPPYLVVDLVRGQSLRVRLNERGRLDPDQAAAVIKSLLDLLDHCHQRGVVHQDLKPENLLIDEADDTLHLLDFGLAATGEAASAERVQVSRDLRSGPAGEGGTFEYMAPERRRGERGGPAADVYAAGVILFEALTLELPRGLTRLRELCGAPASLEALCSRMLAPEAQERPSAREAARTLGAQQPWSKFFGARGRRRARAASAAPRRPAAATLAAAALAGALALALQATGHGASWPAAAAGAVGALSLAVLALAPRLRLGPREAAAALVGAATLGVLAAAPLVARPAGSSGSPELVGEASPALRLSVVTARLEGVALDAPATELDVVLDAARAELEALAGERALPPRALLLAELRLARLTAWSEARRAADRASARGTWELARLEELGASSGRDAETTRALRAALAELERAVRLDPLAGAIPHRWQSVRRARELLARHERALRAEARRAQADLLAPPGPPLDAAALARLDLPPLDPRWIARARREHACSAFLAAEELCPRAPEFDELALALPLRGRAVAARRRGLVRELLQAGDLPGAAAVVARTRAGGAPGLRGDALRVRAQLARWQRTPIAPPGAAATDDPLRERARELGHGFDLLQRALREPTPARALEQARRARSLLREVAAAVLERLEPALEARATERAQLVGEARARLWRTVGSATAAAAFAAEAGRLWPQDPELAALRAVALALAGQEGDAPPGEGALAAALVAYRAARASRAAREARLAQALTDTPSAFTAAVAALGHEARQGEERALLALLVAALPQEAARDAR